MVEREQKRAGVWLGRNIRERREALGLSQNDVAAAMTARGHPWHQVTVYRVERGGRTVEVHEALALAELFDTSVLSLVGQPESTRRRWEIEGLVTGLDDAYGGLYDVVWALTDARVKLEHALAHAHPDDDADLVEDARTALAEQSVEAVVAEVDEQRVADQAERQGADDARRAREDAEAVQLAEQGEREREG